MDTAARIAPWSRRRRVSRRVSIPSMPSTPEAARASRSVASDRHDEARRAASRTAKPATCTPDDSGSSAFIP